MLGGQESVNPGLYKKRDPISSPTGTDLSPAKAKKEDPDLFALIKEVRGRTALIVSSILVSLTRTINSQVMFSISILLKR